METLICILFVCCVSIAFVLGMAVGSCVEQQGQADTDALKQAQHYPYGEW